MSEREREAFVVAGDERARVVPDGYLLTTTELRFRYVMDEDRCSEEAHRHPEHVLVWPAWGSADVEIDASICRVSVGQGVWLPAGTLHAASRSIDTPLCCTHVVPESWSGPSHSPKTVAVNAALRELLLYLAVAAMPQDQRVRGQQVCLELIEDEGYPIIQVPVVRDERIAAIAGAVMSDPGDDRTLEEWAWTASMSSRTIARAFRSDTGMTFSEWRTCVRMMAAVELLGRGTPVNHVARRVGYARPSAFTVAFRRVLGRTPQRFLPTSAGGRQLVH